MSIEVDRKQLLSEAHRARNRGQDRQAIALYKRVLREEPRNIEVALRTAPLLARRGETFEAWMLFRTAARQLARGKRYDECLSVYVDACRYVPHEFDAWRLRAELEMKLGREDAAFESLLDGRTQFRDVRTRAQAISLLTRARTLEPWDPELVLDLARLYARTDQAEAALELLGALAPRTTEPRTARRIRALQLRITLSPQFAWLWVRATFRAATGSWTGSPTQTDSETEEPAQSSEW